MRKKQTEVQPAIDDAVLKGVFLGNLGQHEQGAQELGPEYANLARYSVVKAQVLRDVSADPGDAYHQGQRDLLIALARQQILDEAKTMDIAADLEQFLKKDA